MAVWILHLLSLKRFSLEQMLKISNPNLEGTDGPGAVWTDGPGAVRRPRLWGESSSVWFLFGVF